MIALCSRHSWTFRAETHAKLLEWYEDLKKLTELSGANRAAFVASYLPTSAEEQNEEVDDAALLANDEADEIPYSASNYSIQSPSAVDITKRPELGRFPSDIRLDRGIQEARRPSSSEDDRYVLVSTNPNDPTNPRHHSRSSSAFSYDETVSSPSLTCAKLKLININTAPVHASYGKQKGRSHASRR